ncbi:Homeobox protein vent1 [Merluccius polli]|uniref:Homeobox protein vent1 n=1 Tax=Merluccius polli TaxID=89951 RepID=A0AA47MRP7_MERPO|nr:Homeobox protein vent1 [Merluccius polli]
MANFSIEWLSKSFYPTHKDGEPDHQSAPRPDTAPPGRTISIEVLSKDKYPPTSPNNSCGYTSGSESEQGDDGGDGGGEGEGEASSLHRRMRTKFTSEQIGRLENTFGKHRYLGATQRRKMAEKLNLSETQVSHE